MVTLLVPFEVVMVPLKLPQLVDATLLLVWRTKFAVLGQNILTLSGGARLMPNCGAGVIWI